MPTPTPDNTDADQSWFWTPEWQTGERQADADIAAGNTTFYPSTDAFLDALAQLDEPASTTSSH